MSDLLDVEQVRAMATPAGALWAGERAPTALALARTALAWLSDRDAWRATDRAKAAEAERDAVTVERDEAYRQRDNYEMQINDARAILGAAAGDLLSNAAERLRERVADLEAAEAVPPQVFRPPISVTVCHVTGHAFAGVEVGDVTDPAFLALPMGVRLGLVVCDD